MSRIEGKDVFICYMSGPKMVKAVDNLLSPKSPEFGCFISCAVRQMALGDKIYQAQRKLADYFKERPFLLAYTAGESLYEKKAGLKYLNESIASVIFRR